VAVVIYNFKKRVREDELTNDALDKWQGWVGYSLTSHQTH